MRKKVNQAEDFKGEEAMNEDEKVADHRQIMKHKTTLIMEMYSLKLEEDEVGVMAEAYDRNARRRYDKSEIQCYICKKFSHHAFECHPNTNNDGKKVKFVDMEEKDEAPVLLMAYDNIEAGHCMTWYLDTGASNHMCGRKELRSELNDSHVGNITFGYPS